jgi:hypothetical protein
MVCLKMIIIENHIYCHHKRNTNAPQPAARADRSPLGCWIKAQYIIYTISHL